MAGDVVGQWLGRVGPAAGSIDWLAVIDALPGSCPANAALDWTPIDALGSGSSLLDYQQWAVAAVLERGDLPSVRGPFGNLAWLDEVKAWIGGAVGEADSGPITPYRVTSHEVVLGAQTRRGRVYFKGLAPDRAVEARLTRTLSAFVPGAFARTLALEERPERSVWWLAAECPGHALPGCSSAELAGNVARALARAQRRVMASPPILRELLVLDLSAAAAWSACLLGDTACGAGVEQGCNYVGHADVPQSWIPLDLDPINVLIDDDGAVRFIDLDDSYFGPAPLAIAAFARRCRNASVYRAYEQAWSPPLQGVDWPAFEIAAAIVGAWLGWKRVKRNTDRGEVHGVLDLATGRLAQRLSALIYRR